MKTGHTVISHSIAPILEDFHIVRNIPNQYTSIKLMTRTKEKKKGKNDDKNPKHIFLFCMEIFHKMLFFRYKDLVCHYNLYIQISNHKGYFPSICLW